MQTEPDPMYDDLVVRERNANGRGVVDAELPEPPATPPDAVRIRVAQRLIKNGAPLSVDDPGAVAVFVPWIEIDGHRISAFRDVNLSMGAHATNVVVDFIGAVEIVFVDINGEEITP